MVSRLTTSTPASVSWIFGEHPGTHQTELFAPGDQDPRGRIGRCLGEGERGDDSAAVVAGPLRLAPQPAPPGQRSGQHRETGSRRSQAQGKRPAEPSRRETAAHRHRGGQHPDGHQAPGHGLRLSLGIEVRHDPAPDRNIGSDRDEVGVFPRLPELQPPRGDAGREAGRRRDQREPDDEGAPRGYRRQVEKRKREQRGGADAGAEDGKSEQGRGWKRKRCAVTR